MDRMNWFYHYCNSDISFTSLLVVYLVNSLKNSPFKRVYVFFFICMLVSKEGPVRVVGGNQLFLRGQEVKATVFRTAHIVWLWFWVVRGQVKSNWGWWGFNSLSLSWTDRSSIHRKLKSKLGVECRKTLGSTARPGRETLIAQRFWLIFKLISLSWLLGTGL